MQQFKMSLQTFTKVGSKWVSVKTDFKVVSSNVKKGFINGSIRDTFKAIKGRLIQKGSKFTLYLGNMKIEHIFTILDVKSNCIVIAYNPLRRFGLSYHSNPILFKVRRIRERNKLLCSSINVSKSLMTKHLREELALVKELNRIRNKIVGIDQ